MENPASTSLFEMEIDSYAQANLNTISRWGRFISITGLIVLGLSLLLIIMLGQRFINAFSNLMPGGDLGGDDIESGVTTIVWGVVAILLFYFALYTAWCYFLLRASNLLKKGLVTRNVSDIAEGFSSIRNLFIVGIILATLSALTTLYTMLNF